MQEIVAQCHSQMMMHTKSVHPRVGMRDTHPGA